MSREKVLKIRKAIGICNRLKPGKCKSKNSSRLFKKLAEERKTTK